MIRLNLNEKEEYQEHQHKKSFFNNVLHASRIPQGHKAILQMEGVGG